MTSRVSHEAGIDVAAAVMRDHLAKWGVPATAAEQATVLVVAAYRAAVGITEPPADPPGGSYPA